MARSKVTIRFTAAETEQLQGFCNMVGMDLHTMVKRSTIYAMNDTLNRAKAMQAEEKKREELAKAALESVGATGELDATYNAPVGDAAGNQDQVSTSEGLDSNPLADQKTAGTEVQQAE